MSIVQNRTIALYQMACHGSLVFFLIGVVNGLQYFLDIIGRKLKFSHLPPGDKTLWGTFTLVSNDPLQDG